MVLETETRFWKGFIYTIKVFGLQPKDQGHYRVFAAERLGCICLLEGHTAYSREGI